MYGLRGRVRKERTVSLIVFVILFTVGIMTWITLASTTEPLHYDNYTMSGSHKYNGCTRYEDDMNVAGMLLYYLFNSPTTARYSYEFMLSAAANMVILSVMGRPYFRLDFDCDWVSWVYLYPPENFRDYLELHGIYVDFNNHFWICDGYCHHHLGYPQNILSYRWVPPRE